MRLYQGSLNQFKDDVIKNKIADLISSKYFSYYGRNVSPSERNSWNISLNFMKNAIVCGDDQLLGGRFPGGANQPRGRADHIGQRNDGLW